MDDRPDQTHNLSDAEDTSENDRGGMLRSSTSVLAWLAGIALTVIALDVLTKSLVVALLDPQRPVHIIGDAVTLRLVRNSGAAFSMASGYTWILTLIALAVVVVIIRFSRRLRSGWWVLGLGLVLGGAIGNLIDRIFRDPAPLRGHVVDFISVGWWPVFNVADSSVVCGAVLLVVLSLLGYDYDGSRSGFAARRAEKVEAENA
ncbi:signal peptidase II [Gordonia sp. w5E2]|uniref:Lipoprotein signal peptidase n=1 Tax=Gordonia jacobaea TaxID=122202 RepID=A0ABR5IE67_9ACTN|nr:MULTISPECIES: signal peptidase II [Gordonia]KNA91884.1 signal peptidase [Gordonia jacobaea]OBC07359.1 signal peptidase II [Gordonia sp. 852002-50816_SCH5313054-a]OBC09080.1 signal peptidase II [Gordonia sp. 852002-50395_SCH5434458]OBC20844.1 signal peptidase II [Gordonia sp. 852002-50816_SCH5313054-c]